MNSFTIPFVDISMAQQLEECHTWRCVEFAKAHARLQPTSRSEVQVVAGGYAVFAGADSPLNKASGLGFTGSVTAEDVDRIEEFYRSRDSLPRIEVCPLADPTLRNLLKKRGYRLESFLNVLFRPVPTEPLPVVLAANASISQATPEQADAWIRTTAQGFEGVETPSLFGRKIQASTFHSDDAVCFLAWVDIEPAAGGAMVVHDKVTEFGGMSTRLPYRRRGLQMGLINTRLNVALEVGCDFAMILTSPGSQSQRNIERAGFQVAYTNALMVAL